MPEQQRRDIAHIVAMFLISAAIVVSTVIGAQTVKYVKTFNTSLLNVTGAASQIITSDEVKWNGSFFVNTDLSTLSQGYAQMNQGRQSIDAFLHKNGIPISDITFSTVSMNQNFIDCKQFPKSCNASGSTSYQLTQSVRIESHQVNKITALAQEINVPLVKQGILFSTQDLKYYYDKLDNLRTTMLAARDKGREKACATGGGQCGRAIGKAGVRDDATIATDTG
ncbi:MAG: SIMPL domain-containing protein [Bacilli bacterium]